MQVNQRQSPLLLKAVEESAYPVSGSNAVEEVLSAYARGVRNFSGAEIYWESLYQAELQGIIFSNSKLTVDLRETKLMGADFSN
ncbi:pentapeptide repeat-containing protein, partial [Acaryochloris marina NIES-2412]|uniref:pentapeptide repeat-containing protein n=1 Tax=Acaryochloris marina TaxID=155978 RepID=UPI0040588D75